MVQRSKGGAKLAAVSSFPLRREAPSSSDCRVVDSKDQDRSLYAATEAEFP